MLQDTPQVQTIVCHGVPGTPAENILYFEVENGIVRAVFTSLRQAGDYFQKYAPGNFDGRYSVNNCDFTLNGNTIEAESNSSTSGHWLLMFLNGLKNLID